MFLYISLFALTILFLWLRGSKRRAFAYKIGGPFASGYPLLGNALDFVNNFDKTLLTLCNFTDQYGDRYSFSFGPAIVFVTTRVEDMEVILTSQNIIDKSEEYDLVSDWLKNGLITSTGAHWSQRRKLITPTFHFSILERFINPINTHANILVDILRQNFLDSKEENYYKDICPYVARCALDIICETSMGKRLNAQMQRSNDYVEAVHRMGELFQYRSIRPWLRLKLLWNLTQARKEEKRCLQVIHSFTDQVIKDRKRLKSVKEEKDESLGQKENEGKVRLALLDLLLTAQESNVDFDDEGLKEECNTFMFAGHDTVSVAVSFCLFTLGNNMNAQEKLHHELDTVLGQDPQREITMTDIREMKYLECCIKESLRLFPSVPLIGRDTKRNFELDTDTVIPPGITVFIFPYKLHRNPKYFSQPDEFLPERWEEGSELRPKHNFAYIPFSAGPRNCIGQKLAMIEAKVVLASILRRFTVKSEKKIDELELLSEIVLRSRGGIKVQLEERF